MSVHTDATPRPGTRLGQLQPVHVHHAFGMILGGEYTAADRPQSARHRPTSVYGCTKVVQSYILLIHTAWRPTPVPAATRQRQISSSAQFGFDRRVTITPGLVCGDVGATRAHPGYMQLCTYTLT